MGCVIAERTYRLLQDLDRDDRLVFATQANRAALSIPSNIAEGGSRRSAKDNARFVEIALGSSYELETQLLVMQKLQLLSTGVEELMALIDEEQKMLFGYLTRLRT